MPPKLNWARGWRSGRNVPGTSGAAPMNRSRGEIDMLPGQRRDMAKEFVGNWRPERPKMLANPRQIDRVPVNYGAGNQIETRSAIGLAVECRSRISPLSWMKIARLSLCAALALVEAGLAPPAQRRVRIPFDHEPGALEPPELAEGTCELAWVPRRSELLQDGRRRDGLHVERDGKPEEFVPVLANQCDINDGADVALDQRIVVPSNKGMEVPAFQVPEPRREAFSRSVRRARRRDHCCLPYR